MTLPVGISTCLVTFGKSISADGTEGTITARLVLNRDIVWTATGTRIVNGNNLITTESGVVQVTLPHVDQAGFIDATTGGATTNWLYTLIFTITVGNTTTEVRRNVQPLVGQTVRDLDTEGEGEVVVGVTHDVTSVTSVDGDTGIIDLSSTYAPLGEDTGWRDVGPEWSGGDLPANRLIARREGDDVSLYIDPDYWGNVLTVLGGLPVPEGWRPRQINGRAPKIPFTLLADDGTAAALLLVSANGFEAQAFAFQGVIPDGGSWSLASVATGLITYKTDDAPLEVLPGTAYTD